MATAIHTGMSLRDALEAARELGAEVFIRTGTGEVTIQWKGEKPLQVNSRRKSASRVLISKLRQHAKTSGSPST